MIKSVHDYQIDDVFKKDAGFATRFRSTNVNTHGDSINGKISMMIFAKTIMDILLVLSFVLIILQMRFR